jgi:hypothetical protein
MWDVLKSKADPLGRVLADRHYTRQSIGATLWTRPGYNFVLYYDDSKGAALWCWWRPKWEAGVGRFDKLIALECTMFRNESDALSSSLVRDAVSLLEHPLAEKYLKIERPYNLPLITGVSSKLTASRRGRNNLPGHCYRKAGWKDFEHSKLGKADVWLILYPHCH